MHYPSDPEISQYLASGQLRNWCITTQRSTCSLNFFNEQYTTAIVIKDWLAKFFYATLLSAPRLLT